MHGRYGKNQWKIKVFSLISLVIVLILIAVFAFFGYTYFQKKQAGAKKEAKIQEEIQAEPEIPSVPGEEDTEAKLKAEIDTKVQEIGTQVTMTLTNVSSGAYEELAPSSGVKVYRENDEVKSVVMNKEVTGDGYTHMFYYNEGSLICALYDGEDAHKLFFSDGTIIRWEYCPDTSNPGQVEDHDMEDSADYNAWGDKALSEANGYLNMEFSQVEPVSMGNVNVVTSTSALSEYGMTHSADRVWDNDISTAWVEGVSGNGEGESLVFVFDDTYRISGLNINAGYQKNSDLYGKNSRPAKLELTFSSGEVYTVDLADQQSAQSINLPAPVDANSVTVKIVSVYSGWKYTDTAITELSFY
ncbi:MAG: NADase-type glycan-binding domain-containing protein [Blautia wexlerae]